MKHTATEKNEAHESTDTSKHALDMRLNAKNLTVKDIVNRENELKQADRQVAKEFVGDLEDELQPDKNKSLEDSERFIEDGAYGKTISRNMSDSMRQRIRNNPELRKIRDEMKASNTGATIEGDQELMNELMAVFGLTKVESESESESEEEYEEEPVGRAGLGARIRTPLYTFQARRGEKRQQAFDNYVSELEEQGYDEAEIEKKLKRHEKWNGYKRAIGIGAVAIGAYLAYREVNAAANGMGLTWFGFGGPGLGAREAVEQGQQGGKPNAGPGNAGDLPQGNKNGLSDYFNAPDTSKLPNLHHANDFSLGNPDLSAMNKDGALKNLEDMFRGNPRITAMWASELHIPGAPNMPSVDVLENNPNALVNYNHEVNSWGDFLQAHPDTRKDVTNQLVDALRNGSLGNKRTLDYGYLSSGSNNRPGQVIFGTTQGQVFIDPEVDYKNVEAVEWHVNGQTVLVEPGCNQLAFQVAHPQAQQTYVQPTYSRHYQPQPKPRYYQPPAPPVYYQPVTPPPYIPQTPPELPPPPQTPQLPPEIPQPPQPPLLPPEIPQPPSPPSPPPIQNLPKNPLEDINVNPALPPQVQMGGVRMPSGPLQSEQSVAPPPVTYKAPSLPTFNNNTPAPSSRPSGIFGHNQPSQPGVSKGKGGVTLGSVGE